jgi:hypothetical protein
MKKPTEIDHIDPRWEEGRDYQLVCGLDVEENLITRKTSENARKTNRFLPWRFSLGELGAVPTRKGDLCQFLDPVTEDWVLEEFLGEWWFEKTKTLCGNSVSGGIAVKTGQLALARSKVDKPVQLAAARKNRDPQEHSDWGKTFAQQTNTTMWKCCVTGYVTTAGPLTLYQRHRNIDTSLRVRVKPNNCVYPLCMGLI